MTIHTFEAIHNFRDCGGYPAAEGRAMRRGVLFRSAHYPQATDTDLATMRKLGLAAIVDLRRPQERELHPSPRWPGFDARVVTHPGRDGMVLPPHLVAFERAGKSGEEARAAMTQICRDMPLDPMFIELMREYFVVLAEAKGAVLVHCAAGKDRTGVAVALTHHMLGVSEADMLANYLATNDSVAARHADVGPALHLFFAREGRTVSDDAIRTILGVEEGYLRAAFGTMDAEYGSRDGYLEDAVGVTPAQRAMIVRRLTEEAL